VAEGVTRILRDIQSGDDDSARDSARRLLPLVYDELRKLAAQRLRHEQPGQTLQATALVHEAYLRLVGPGPVGTDGAADWQGRAHFFAAAAEAMRRILVDNARRKQAGKHGGGRVRVELADVTAPAAADPHDLVALDAALSKFEREDKAKADLVKLHYFTGLSLEDAAAALGLSRATAYRHWTYARAWLLHEMAASEKISRP
jgi:RNA polymerase sigma factor (TIGR02999 family)